MLRVALVAGLVGPGAVHAGTITRVVPPAGVEFTLPTPLPFPNNDDFEPGDADGPNVISGTKTFRNMSPLDTVFIVDNSDGTTEYLFSRERVNNMTASDWNDFHFELGFGTGAGFIRSTINDGLDFDTPLQTPTPTSDEFMRLVHRGDTMDWSRGLVVKRDFVLFTFSLDVPNNTNIPVDFRLPSGYAFTLRQRPTAVPEPSSLVLGATGAVLGLACVWRGRRD
jgi:hypothetical protein